MTLPPGPPQGTSRREQRVLQERLDILEAAADLFGRQGYAATSVQEIAERAEFSVGKLYKFFPSKDEILAGLVEHHRSALDAIEADVEALGLSPLEELREGLVRTMTYLTHHEGFLRFHFGELAGACRAEVRQRDHQRLAGCLTRAVREGMLVPDVDPEVVAASLQGTIASLVEMYVDQHRVDRLAEVAEYAHRLLVKPLLRRPESREEMQA